MSAEVSSAEAGALAVELDETEGTDRYNTTETADGGNTDGDNPGLGRATTAVTGGLVNLFAALGGDYGSDGAGTTSGSFSFTGFPPGGELATTLSATNGGAITLVRTSATLLTGEDTDGHTVFTIAIVDVGGGVYQLQTTLYEALNHGDNENPDLFDETVELLLAADGAVQLQYEVTRTDADGDSQRKPRANEYYAGNGRGQNQPVFLLRPSHGAPPELRRGSVNNVSWHVKNPCKSGVGGSSRPINS